MKSTIVISSAKTWFSRNFYSRVENNFYFYSKYQATYTTDYLNFFLVKDLISLTKSGTHCYVKTLLHCPSRSYMIAIRKAFSNLNLCFPFLSTLDILPSDSQASINIKCILLEIWKHVWSFNNLKWCWNWKYFAIYFKLHSMWNY